MSREIEDGLGHGGLVATRAEREQERRDQAERKRFREMAERLERIRMAFQALRDGREHASASLYRVLAAEFPANPEAK